METTGGNPPLVAWQYFGAGYTASTNTSHGGVHSLECTSGSATGVHGGYQVINLNQTKRKALKLSGWSKAQDVSGTSDDNYSVYLDIYYTNGTPLWDQTVHFSTGTHNWEYQERLIPVDQAIAQVYCYVLFRSSHTGTVWFDDITVAEVQDPTGQFDGAAVINGPPSPLPFNPTNLFTLSSGDGLQLQIAQDGGVIEKVADGTNNLQAAGADYASGWLICDRGAISDWWNVGGWVTGTNGILQQQSVITALNLTADVRYSVSNDAIRIQATLSNLISSDRALSLYFALPADMEGGFWWNSPRERVSLDQTVESATFCNVALGARNLLSQYPLATVARNSALTLAVPPDQYRPCRLTYNRATHQFFAAFDVGLSSIPTNFPQMATVEVWLYRSDPAWGMRSSLAGFYRRFPSAFARTFTNEGIWVAFANLGGITNISDFGIAYHEIGYDPALVESDDTNSIQSFRYVSEPCLYWMDMSTNVPNTNYSAVYNNLLAQYSQGEPLATATLSSGVRAANGLLEFLPAAAPWCPYGAAFCLNASPFISDPQYPITKFSHDWNASVRDVYNHPENGRLDGEYIDGFCGYAMTPDYSITHQRTTSFPLLYTRDNYMLMTPLIFGTYEMARAISADVHALGKPLMANAVFIPGPYLPIGLGIFDFAGAEINWFDASGNWVPPRDGDLLLARTLSGQRPYGYLLNTDFSKVTHDKMEAYMRLCAVYGIYPSAFSANAMTGNYFEQPALYERDRALFKKYIPIVRALSLAGWQPVTEATTDTTNVGLETFGTNSFTGTRYLAIRNFASNTVGVNVTFDLPKWANPNSQWLRLTNLFDGGGLNIDVGSGSNSATLTLQPYECRVYGVQSSRPTRPTICLNDGSFGFHSNEFGFNVSGLPSQVVVIEAADNLVNWVPIRTNPIPYSGAVFFSDLDSATLTTRFYRARFQ